MHSHLYFTADTSVPLLIVIMGMQGAPYTCSLAIVQAVTAQTLIAKNHNMPWAGEAGPLSKLYILLFLPYCGDFHSTA